MSSNPRAMSSDSFNMTYAVALKSAKMLRDHSVVDLTNDDFDFLCSQGAYEGKLWLPVDRARARRCVEACVYGALDMLGYPRFRAPVEFIAAAITTFVWPANYMTAAIVCEGAEYSANVVAGIDKPVDAATLFSHILQLAGGQEYRLQAREANIRDNLQSSVALERGGE